jgi:uncharacterized membrane protein YvbJ
MIKCPVCKEEIQDDAIKCKHCGEVLNKTEYADSRALPTQGAPEVKIPIGKLMRWMRRTVVVPLAFLVVLCIGFNAQRFHYCSVPRSFRELSPIDFRMDRGGVRRCWVVVSSS